MTRDALLLVGRDTPHARDVLDTHAQRLRDRDVADAVHVAVYEDEPIRELRGELSSVDAEVVYAVPMVVGHTYETRDALPRALSAVPGEVRYCEPLGRSPALTGTVVDRATRHLPADEDVSLVLVGFGSGSLPYQRQVVEYHAARLRDRTAFGGVVTCYLLQNPTVECVRYEVTTDRAVAVPLFFARDRATEERIPEKLEVDRGGLAYADPLGDHPGVTDAVAGEVAKQRAIAGEPGADSFGASLADDRRPLATDGEGRP